MTAKKRTQKYNASDKLLFYQSQSKAFIAVLVAVAVVVRYETDHFYGI